MLATQDLTDPHDTAIFFDAGLNALSQLAREHTIATPAADEWPHWARQIAQVLAANLASGRFRMTAESTPAESLCAYACRVARHLLAEGGRLALLQAGDRCAWAAVLERLERLAYWWYGPIGREEWAAWNAREVASATCADLWRWLQSHTFPFDVPLDAWIARALVNRLHEANERRRADEARVVESLDRKVGPGSYAATVGEELLDPTAAGWMDRIAEREALSAALAQMRGRRALVLRLWYLEGWPAEEIACRLCTPVSNVYLLRHRGLKALRRKLAAEW